MAYKFEILGNFFSVTDTVTNDAYVIENSDSIKYYRNADYDFSFYYKGSDSTGDTAYLNRIGVERKVFEFANIVDSSGSSFVSEEACETFLYTNLG